MDRLRPLSYSGGVAPRKLKANFGVRRGRLAELALDVHRAGPGTVDPNEIAHFNTLAATWWDENGAMRPLHQINAARLVFLRNQLARNFALDDGHVRPFGGLRLLDVGCGGGLVAEPMCRLGFEVTGIDAAAKNIGVARTHAAAGGLTIDYRNEAAEDMAGRGTNFDVVLALEIIEHVIDPNEFVTILAQLVRPGGMLIMSTINRTLRSYALGIVAAEMILRWLPQGTHRWEKFVKPSELAAALRNAGMEVSALAGLSYRPLSRAWAIDADVSVNYLMAARKL